MEALNIHTRAHIKSLQQHLHIETERSYIGQTKRHLKTRLKEHVKNTELYPSGHSQNTSINSTMNSIGIILRFWTLKLTIIKDSSQR